MRITSIKRPSYLGYSMLDLPVENIAQKREIDFKWSQIHKLKKTDGATKTHIFEE